MKGLLAEQAALPQESAQREGSDDAAKLEQMSSPEAMQKAVQLVYGEHFDKVKQLIANTDASRYKKELPILLNLIMKRVRQEVDLDIESGVATIVRLLVMVLEDMVKTVTDGPISLEDFNDIIRGTVSLFLKGNKDLVTPEMDAELRKVGATMERTKGNPAYKKVLDKAYGKREEKQPQAEEPQPQEEMA